jgi:hypothetical protein
MPISDYISHIQTHMLIIPTHRVSVWHSTLFLPVYIALLSVAVLVVHLILLATPLKKFILPPSSPTSASNHDSEPPTGFLAEINANITSNGGLSIWLYKVVRLIGCLALFAVSIAAAVIAGDDTLHTNRKHWGKKHKHTHGKKHDGAWFSDYEWIQIALALVYVCPFHLRPMEAKSLSDVCKHARPFYARYPKTN